MTVSLNSLFMVAVYSLFVVYLLVPLMFYLNLSYRHNFQALSFSDFVSFMLLLQTKDIHPVSTKNKKESFKIKQPLSRAWWLIPVIPELWKAKAGRSPEVRSLRPAQSTWQNPISTKNTKISWAWQHVPVIPTIPETEAEESLDPRRWRLQ